MKIALTGATGFLGSYLRTQLTDAGYQMIAWHRPESPPPESESIHGGSLQWIPGRLGDTDATEALIAQADCVVHAGLYRCGDRFIGDEGDPLAYFENNIIGSVKLLESAVKNQSRRFVFISSGAVHDRVAENRPLDESHPLWPSSLYGGYKAAVETLIHAYGLSHRLDCCTLRPTAIYGSAPIIEESKWYQLVQDVAAGKKVEASGGSKEVHAADVAKAIVLLLETDRPVAGECFNCSDRLISRYEVAEIAKRLSNSDAKISGGRKESKHPMDTTKLRSLGMSFGGTPRLESTITEMIRS